MKGNNGKGDISSRDSWETPDLLWTTLNEQYHFSIDCCASYRNTKCKHYYTKEKPFECSYFIRQNMCWMNPPFSIAKKMFSHFVSYVSLGVAIYRSDNLETSIWQKVIFPNIDWIFILNKRVNYVGLDGKGVRFPSALIGVGVNPPEKLKGTLLRI